MNPGQVQAIIEALGLTIPSETETNYLLFCPFHRNIHTPAMSMSKESGLFLCYSGACNERGRMIDFVRKVKGWNTLQCMRFIEKHKTAPKTVEQVLEEIYATHGEMPEFSKSLIEQFQINYWASKDAQNYITGQRHITERSAKHFGIGYDPTRKMTIVPMYDTDSRPIGVIGRSIEGKQFKNSKNLPSRKSLFNIQNAKRAGSENLVLVESSFDAIRVHQAGYPNVCATLGSFFTKYHLTQIGRHFNNLVIMVDSDKPGMKFADKIANESRQVGLSVKRGRHSEAELYPHYAKDCGDMTDKEIAWCIRNADLML
jgi:DNA primase